VSAQTQQTHVQRLSPENKGVSPYIPLQADYRSKKQGLIHVWFYLILLATVPSCYVTFPSLVLCDRPHVQISQVLSLCYAIPTSLLLSQDSGLDCFLLILLAATLPGSKQDRTVTVFLGGHGEHTGKPSVMSF
jgi:hypothetical protein